MGLPTFQSIQPRTASVRGAKNPGRAARHLPTVFVGGDEKRSWEEIFSIVHFDYKE